VPFAATLSALARHWPFANGAGRLVERLGGGIALGQGVRECRTSDGVTLRVLADDLIGRHLILSGQFEASLFRMLLDFAEPGDRFLDLGAHVGYLSTMVLARVPGSQVLAVEPQPDIGALLRHNLGQFPAHRWTILAAALSDREGEGLIAVNPANRGGATLVGQASAATTAVPLLDAGRVLGALDRLDLVKIDIEGHEETVLRASAEAIARLQPRAILFEDYLGKAAPDAPIGRVLTECGYAMFAVRKHVLRNSLQPLAAGDRPAGRDFVALSRSRALPEGARRKYRLSL
jgi:FkbM family methyltransferase